MTERRRRIVWIGLAVLAVVGTWRLVAVEQAKRRLEASYEQAQQTVRQLEGELAGARETMDTQSGELSSLRDELQTAAVQLEAAKGDLVSLQRDYARLRVANTALTEETAALEAKLSDLKQLKLAIRDLKHKIHRERWASWFQRIQARRELDQQQLASGNRGYMIRDGHSTLRSGTKLRVHVLEPQPR